MRIGPVDITERVYVIAELGVNHDGDEQQAHDLIDAAADADADAIKLQAFRADLLMGPEARLAAYQQAAGETDPVAMLARLELDTGALERLVAHARARDIDAIVTIFNLELVDEVGALPWTAFKAASPDIINRPLLTRLAALDRPLLVSTGASELAEVREARQWLDGAAHRLAFLQCVSSYPAPASELGAIPAIAQATGRPVGYSDHTESIQTGREAVRAGARLLERHLTLDRSLPGPDHAASLEPEEFGEYARLARAAKADPHYLRSPKRVLDCERDVRVVSRQSLVLSRDLPQGHEIAAEDLTTCRPGTGLPPATLGEVVGRRLARPVAARTPLHAEDFDASITERRP